MYTGLLHTHTLVVSLYLVLLLIKTVLLLAGQKERLSKFRAKTKVVEMVLATLFLLTGVYLSFESGSIWGSWFIVKDILIVAIIVLGVVAFKRESRFLAFLTLVIFLYVYGISETKSLYFNTDYQALYGGKSAGEQKDWEPQASDYDIEAHGQYVYEQNCIACHGKNGKLQKSGSKNLQNSGLGKEGIQHLVKNGKNSMPAYGEALNDQEIKAVSDYVYQMANN